MVKHIVLFNVKEGEDKDAVAAIAKEALEPLAGKIEGLISLEVCRCFNGCEIPTGQFGLKGQLGALYAHRRDGNLHHHLLALGGGE